MLWSTVPKASTSKIHISALLLYFVQQTTRLSWLWKVPPFDKWLSSMKYISHVQICNLKNVNGWQDTAQQSSTEIVFCVKKIMLHNVFLYKLHSLPSNSGEKNVLSWNAKSQCEELDLKCYPQTPADTGTWCNSIQPVLITLCSWGCKSTLVFVSSTGNLKNESQQVSVL